MLQHPSCVFIYMMSVSGNRDPRTTARDWHLSVDKDRGRNPPNCT